MDSLIKQNKLSKLGLCYFGCVVFCSSLVMMIFGLITRIHRECLKNKFCKNKVVLFTDYHDGVNGVAKYTRKLMQYMSCRDFEFVFTSQYGTDLGERESSRMQLIKCHTLITLNNDFKIQISHPWHIYKVLQSMKPTFVELQTPSVNSMLVMIYCIVSGIGVISNYRTDVLTYTALHDFNQKQKKVIRWWISVILNFSKYILVPSQYVANSLKEDFNNLRNPIKVLQRGVELELFSPLQKSYAITEQSDRGRIVTYCYVGRISKEKELDFLADIWEAFSKMQDKRCRLVIVGEGPYLKLLKERLKESKGVYFKNFLSPHALVNIYRNSDFFVFPSGFDTFGNVVLEAIASGTPALVSNKGGPQEIIENGVSGWVIPYRCTDAWLENLVRTSKFNENLSEKYQKCARERAEQFSFKLAIDDYVSFYRDIRDR